MLELLFCTDNWYVFQYVILMTHISSSPKLKQNSFSSYTWIAIKYIFKWVIIIRKAKDGQHNVQKKTGQRDKQRSTKHYTER